MKKVFRFSIFLLFALLMLLAPLRNAKKEVVQPIVLEDSVRVIAIYQKDTQVVITNTAEGKDTNFTISTTLQKDTVLIQKAKEEPVVIATEKTPIDFRGLANFLLILLFWLCFWGGIAYLVYRFVMARWQQKYWVQYSANAPMLDFVEGQLNYTNKEGVVDFKALEIKPEIKAEPKNDVVINLPEIEEKTTLEIPAEIPTEIPQTVENSTKNKEAVPFFKTAFQKIIQFFSKTKKTIVSIWNAVQKSISKESIVVDKKEAKVSEKEPVVENKTIAIEAIKPTTKTAEKQNSPSVPLQEKIIKTSLEVAKMPFHIAIEATKGIGAILSYFTKKETDNSPAPAIDFRWQDVVTIIFEVVLLFFKQSNFYSQNISFETSAKQIIVILVIAWLVPSLVRKHWAWVVVVVFSILVMLIILLVYMLMQIEPAPGTAEPTDFTGLYIALAVVVLGGLYWKFKHKISAIRLPKIQLPTIKFPTFSNAIKELIFMRIVLFIVIGSVFFYPYFEMGYAVAFEEKGGWGDLFSRAVMGIIVYEICAYFVLQIIKKREADLLNKKYDDRIVKKKKAAQKTALEISSNKPIEQEDYVDLKTLLQQVKNWNTIDWAEIEEVRMSDSGLNEKSKFMQGYLSKCVNAVSLFLDKNKLKKIPQQSANLKKLEVLNLEHNQISWIPSNIENFKNLTTIYLAYNNISDVPDQLALLKNLRYLDLTNNPLTEAAVYKLEKLLPHVTFHVDNKNKRAENRAKVQKNIVEEKDDVNLVAKVSKLLEKELKNPTQVYYISSLMQQGLTDLPLSVLQQFPNLGGMSLHSNQFTTIPDAVYHLPALKLLSLPFNLIKEIPDDIVDLQQIEDLDFSGNPLETISEKLAELPKLKNLELANLKLEKFPEILLKINTLEKINLSNNAISVIPEEIQKLKKVEELNFDFIELELIPNSILGMTNLKVLNWAGNKMIALPKALTQLKKLEKLSVGYNRELVLSEPILGALPNLKSLFVAGIDLGKKQPKFNFAVVKQLRELWLSHNQLTTIPDSIFELEQLFSLGLAGNQITEIPEKIDLLTSLEYLYLNKNAIKKLPNNFKMLKKLRRLDLGGNPIDDEEQKRIKRMLPRVEVVF